MRNDLLLSLKRTGIDPAMLGELQRIFLTTDGTVTDILEAHHRESMVVEVLRQEMVPPDGVDENTRSALQWTTETVGEVLNREILLRGEISGRCMLFATSAIALSRLSPPVRTGLLEKTSAIGHLLLAHRVLTFKEIVGCQRERAGARGETFGIRADAPLLSRTYVIWAEHGPIMVITEKLPEWG
jgi:chorismate-pyruvate lyase